MSRLPLSQLLEPLERDRYPIEITKTRVISTTIYRERSMGWQMYAHRYDKSADEGIDLNPIVEMDCGRNGEMEELLDLRGDLDADNAIDAGTKVSKQKIEDALRHCCRKHADGEDYIWEIQFFANLLINWPNKDRSVHILLS